MGRPKDLEKSSKRNSADALWLPRPQCALLVKVSPSSFDITIKPRIDKQWHKIENNVVHWYAPAVVQAYIAYKQEQEEKKKSKGKDDAVESHVERKKKIDADRAELEFRKELETVVSVEDWEQRLAGRIWNIMDGHGKQLKKLFGNEGVRQFNDFLNEMKRELTGGRVVV